MHEGFTVHTRAGMLVALGYDGCHGCGPSSSHGVPTPPEEADCGGVWPLAGGDETVDCGLLKLSTS